MATNHTTNYALNLWEPTDKFVREEFNENTSKLDAAIKAVSDSKADVSALAALAAQVAGLSQERFCIGSYTGDGTTGGIGNTATRTIPLPWTPKILIVSGYTSISDTHTYWVLTIAFGSYCHQFYSTGGNVNRGDITIVENGFRISDYSHNAQGGEEHFIAIR